MVDPKFYHLFWVMIHLRKHMHKFFSWHMGKNIKCLTIICITIVAPVSVVIWTKQAQSSLKWMNHDTKKENRNKSRFQKSCRETLLKWHPHSRCASSCCLLSCMIHAVCQQKEILKKERKDGSGGLKLCEEACLIILWNLYSYKKRQQTNRNLFRNKLSCLYVE